MFQTGPCVEGFFFFFAANRIAVLSIVVSSCYICAFQTQQRIKEECRAQACFLSRPVLWYTLIATRRKHFTLGKRRRRKISALRSVQISDLSVRAPSPWCHPSLRGDNRVFGHLLGYRKILTETNRSCWTFAWLWSMGGGGVPRVHRRPKK